MAERNPDRNERRPKVRAKAIAGPRRRRQSRVARAFDVVTISLVIWLSAMVAAEGIVQLEQTPPSDPPSLQAVSPANSGR